MNILITGVAGLIGNNFSRYLLNKGHKVIGIDNLFGGYKEYVDNRVNFYCFDVNDAESLEKVFNENQIDIVYHFAAYAAEGLSPFIRSFNYENNVVASVKVINQCIKHNIKIVFTSSVAVYGEIETPYKENQIPVPEDPYGIAKLTVEMDIKQAHKQFGLEYNLVRPHNIIGVYQNIWDRYRNVIGIWINSALNGKSLTIYGDGKQTRAFTDVSSIMQPLEYLGWKNVNAETFNIGSDKEYEVLEVCKLVQKVAKGFGYNTNIEFVEGRHEVKHAFCDHTKAKEIIGLEDKTDIEKVICEMFNWAKKQPRREQKFMAYEIDKNMYSYWR